MMINFPLTDDEIYDIMSESPKFKSIVLAKLFQQQTALAKIDSEPILNTVFLITNLKDYVRNNFRNNTKIPAIKYVRSWCVDNRKNLSIETYNSLYSLVGAKKFVEEIIQY